MRRFKTLRIVCFLLLLTFCVSLFALFKTISHNNRGSNSKPKINLLSASGHIGVQFQKYSDSQSPQSFNKVIPVRYGSAVSDSDSDTQNGVKSVAANKEIESIVNILLGKKFEEAELEISDRINRINHLCKSYHLGKYHWKHNSSNDLGLKEPPTPLYSYFFWNRERHLAWCPVYKAGSTSWLYNMMILAGYSEYELDKPPKQLSILAREVYGDAEPDEETLKQSLKILVVRHPFERIVSAYRDKLSNSTVGHEHGTHHFYKKYGQKIVRKFRTDKTLSQIEPTWEEFVRYLISTDLIHYSDDHWLPAFYSCTPCLVDYDIIAKTETYNRDQEYIISRAGLENILKPRWNHKLKEKEKESNDTFLKSYFNQLTKSQIQALYKKYWFDFELFGYNYEKYLKFGKD